MSSRQNIFVFGDRTTHDRENQNRAMRKIPKFQLPKSRKKNRFPDHFHSFLEDGVATFHSFSSPGAQQTTISTDCNEPNSKKYPTHPQSIQNRLSHCFRFVNHSRMTLDEILSKSGERDSEIKHRSLKNCWKTL